ncbi:hypothetical protein SUGI_1201610 [Cryptomeria japonica]|nr:hypothetical protein SUGI_1201610 [Cryptomeria japonica]
MNGEAEFCFPPYATEAEFKLRSLTEMMIKLNCVGEKPEVSFRGIQHSSSCTFLYHVVFVGLDNILLI